MRTTAMDLGTSNTCISQWADGAVRVLRPEGWHNAALGGAIPTLLLYKNGVPFLIGAAAEHEFGEATAKQRAAYILRGQFKPDIAVQREACVWMEDFLRLLRARVDVQGELLVGIPCQAENHYQQTLRQCLHAAGWQGAHFLREPLGAVLHYVATGALAPSIAARGVLTVDFGGGTCDLAMLRRAEVAARYGDMLYGGRLFDDLFYQLLLEYNPGLVRTLESEGNVYYVHWVACRRAKEDFSAAVAEDRSRPVTMRVRWSTFDGHTVAERAAYIPELTWETFCLRAGAYVACPELRRALAEHAQRAETSPRAQGMLAGKRVDLIAWFDDILHSALWAARKEASHNIEPPLVLLTGGSSAWPFVQDSVRQILGPDTRLIIGDEPYADIAKGLAQYPVLTAHLREGRNALREGLPTFMEERIRRKAIHETLDAEITRLLTELGNFARAVILLPSFRHYRDEGGSLSALMERIVSTTQEQDHRVRALLEDALSRTARRVSEACRAELKAWFREKGIPIVPERLSQTWLGAAMDSFVSAAGQQLAYATLLEGRNAASMAALITGPGLAALAASGTPLAALALGLGGLILMRVFGVDRWLVDKSLDVPVPGMLRRRLFREERLESLCNEQVAAFALSFRTQLFDTWAASENTILAEAGRVASEEIEALDILNISPT